MCGVDVHYLLLNLSGPMRADVRNGIVSRQYAFYTRRTHTCEPHPLLSVYVLHYCAFHYQQCAALLLVHGAPVRT